MLKQADNAPYGQTLNGWGKQQVADSPIKFGTLALLSL
jgi:hypothetical protein